MRKPGSFYSIEFLGFHSLSHIPFPVNFRYISWKKAIIDKAMAFSNRRFSRYPWYLAFAISIPTWINIFQTLYVFSPFPWDSLNYTPPRTIYRNDNSSLPPTKVTASRILDAGTTGGIIKKRPSDSSDPSKDSTSSRLIQEVHPPSLLPKRLISVFGLESSGTTFVASTLCKAMSSGPFDPRYFSKFASTMVNDQGYQIQHISLPMGYYDKQNTDFNQQFLPLPIVDAQLPEECILPRSAVQTGQGPPVVGYRLDAPSECQLAFDLDHLRPYPRRYFVNITSHILFYQERGVDISAVVVVRDTSIHFQGILDNHCPNATAAEEQFRQGRSLIIEALNEKRVRSNIVLVSYESLMMLKESYLFSLYDALRMNTSYAPTFKDGNSKYIRPSNNYKRLHATMRHTATAPSRSISGSNPAHTTAAAAA